MNAMLYIRNIWSLLMDFQKVRKKIHIDFVKENKYTDEEVFECCQRIKEADPQYLACLDYIMAITDYEEFYNLMLDHKAFLMKIVESDELEYER